MPMFPGKSVAKKRVGPGDTEMVSLLKDDTKGKNPGRKPAPGVRSKAFSAVKGMVPSKMIPSVGAGKASDVKKRGGARGDEEKVSLIDSDGKPMAAPGDRKQKSAPTTPWNIKRYLAILVCSFLFTSFILNRQSKDVVWKKHTKELQPSESGEKRCYFKRKNEEERCHCGDPTLGVQVTGTLGDQWKRHHDDMVKIAKNAPALDIVFLGDSVIERFSGTAGMGTAIMDGHKAAFDKRFTKGGGGLMEGKAFGTAGDTGPNVLWHLENGLMDPLDPKIWFIMIGTNDLFTSKCTDHMVIANILNVAKRLSEAHPESLFVLHGIMPRKDNPKSKSQFLGKTWKRAQDINAKIRHFCGKYRNFHYMNAGTLMLAGSKIKGRAQVDPTLMDDGVHPTLKGFEIWGDFVMNRLTGVLKDFEDFKKDIKEGKK